jgi:hypothetical protein
MAKARKKCAAQGSVVVDLGQDLLVHFGLGAYPVNVRSLKPLRGPRQIVEAIHYFFLFFKRKWTGERHIRVGWWWHTEGGVTIWIPPL